MLTFVCHRRVVEIIRCKALDSSRSIKTVIDGARLRRSKRDRDCDADLSTEGETPKKKKKKTEEG